MSDRTNEAFANVPVVLEALGNNLDAIKAFAVIMQASRDAGYTDGFRDGRNPGLNFPPSKRELPFNS